MPAEPSANQSGNGARVASPTRPPSAPGSTATSAEPSARCSLPTSRPGRSGASPARTVTWSAPAATSASMVSQVREATGDEPLETALNDAAPVDAAPVLDGRVTTAVPGQVSD